MSIFSSYPKREIPAHHTHGRGGKPRVSASHVSTSRRRDATSVSTDTDMGAEGTFSGVLMAALWSLPVTAILGMILLLIVTAVAYANPDPDALTTPLGLGALGLTAILGGLVSARRGRGYPLLCGLLLGALLSLLLLCVSLFFGDETRAQLSLGLSPIVLWGLHGGVILLSLLGAKLGSRQKTRTHKTRR